MGLTPQQIEAFETDGFLVGIDAADAEQVRRTQDAFREFENRVGHEKVQTGLGNLHFEEPFAWQLVTNPKVLDCVGSLVGPDILLMRTRTFCKYGPSNDFVAWHQDVICWGLEPPSLSMRGSPSTTATPRTAVSGSSRDLISGASANTVRRARPATF